MIKATKKLALALFIAGSTGVVGGYSTVAVAAESAGGVAAAIAGTLKGIDASLAAAEGGDQDATFTHIQLTRQMCKDITGDSWAMNTQKTSTALRIAKSRTKKGDLDGAKEKLLEAKELMGKVRAAFDAH